MAKVIIETLSPEQAHWLKAYLENDHIVRKYLVFVEPPVTTLDKVIDKAKKF